MVAVGCQTASAPTAVDFGSAQPIGRWAAQELAGAAALPAGAAALPAAGSGSTGLPDTQGVLGPTGTAGQLSGAGTRSSGGVAGIGSAGAMALAGRNGSAGKVGASGMPAAGSGGMLAAAGGGAGGGAAGTTALGVSSLAFDVTTSPVGGQYQPRNIGAIWVVDSNGKLVKSLEVWAAQRRRYLTGYAAALAGSSVDVTASATLPSHRAHHATWNMKDRNGSALAPGNYKLVVETTDGDMTGRSISVPFDTSAGLQILSPANAPSFSSMKLVLQ